MLDPSYLHALHVYDQVDLYIHNNVNILWSSVSHVLVLSDFLVNHNYV